MWSAPVSAAAFLPHVVRAAREAGFSSLLVVLARGADAAPLQRELTREWTSIHDVTGHLVAVLCPEPATAKSPITTFTSMSGRFLRDVAQMHDLRVFPLGGGYAELAGELVMSVSRHSEPGTRIDGHSYTAAPFTPREHHLAWTEAASRCATHFGIPEADLPALLLLDFPEPSALLLTLRPDSPLSPYRLCKEIAEQLGCTKRAAALFAEAEELARAEVLLAARAERGGGRADGPADDEAAVEAERARLLAVLDDPLSAHLDAELRAAYAGLDQHLCRVEDVEPDLVAQWRTRLGELTSSGAPVTVRDALHLLFDVLGRVRAEGSGGRRWLGLHRKARKVLRATAEALGVELDWDLSAEDPVGAALDRFDRRRDRCRARAEEEPLARERAQVLLRGTRERLAVVGRELSEIRDRARAEGGTVAAAERAAHRLLGVSAAEERQGHAGLDGYRVRVVREPEAAAPRAAHPATPLARPGASATANNVSGHAELHGPVVQARDISGGIHIHPPPDRT
ncbi:hypothetical protein HUT18_09030 [Streptomyces sp. NA04227]|uniref:hypothetical protein n=1 Tax=Streptomyces sp. NA04227 TaxID=2742136 RepID=UPI00158FBEBA|nr:hypothetical protein [Streptomyces sp. NA04227]QKW06524.1 hypothetical protein HUT18_09030 [Streptomyces sp. NA04227]